MHVLEKMPQADTREYSIPFKQRRYVRSSLLVHISATLQILWPKRAECTTALL
jgi:hypothetical protein